MNHDRNQPEDSWPSPEQLAAYVDGELGPSDRETVEGWLAQHPAAARDVDDWRRLARMWQTTVPPEPSAAAWNATRGRIETALAARRSLVGLYVVAGMAAAALLAVLLARPLWNMHGEPDEPFPVASAQDVVILSMDPGDAGALVVGQPPSLGPIELAQADDVILVSAEPLAGATSDMWQGGSPMIIPTGREEK